MKTKTSLLKSNYILARQCLLCVFGLCFRVLTITRRVSPGYRRRKFYSTEAQKNKFLSWPPCQMCEVYFTRLEKGLPRTKSPLKTQSVAVTCDDPCTIHGNANVCVTGGRDRQMWQRWCIECGIISYSDIMSDVFEMYNSSVLTRLFILFKLEIA